MALGNPLRQYSEVYDDLTKLYFGTDACITEDYSGTCTQQAALRFGDAILSDCAYLGDENYADQECAAPVGPGGGGDEYTGPPVSGGSGFPFSLAGFATKASARAAVQNLGISAEQYASVNRKIGAATASSTIDLYGDTNGNITIDINRPGINGYQVFESIVAPNGETTIVVQMAYDQAGNLVHYDVKYPGP